MRLGGTAVVAATFQEARHFTPSTSARYRDLVTRTGFVCALGEDLPVEPVPGVRGAALDPADPVRGEWDLVVLAPHFAAALLARDLGDAGPDLERTFEFALTYDRETVARAARSLLSRVAPRTAAPTPRAATAAPPSPAEPAPSVRPATTEDLLHRALSATTSGVTISDMRQPDQPLVFVNAAFEQLSGFRLEEVLGRNCRFLQGDDTDLAAVGRMRDAIARGEEVRETLLNVRGPERTPWWNEIHLAPVTDEHGTVVQYIGVQNDVTARVEAERALEQERDRARSYLSRIEQLAFTDPLTGLPNRRRLEEQVERLLLEARLAENAVALLFIDLNGFKTVNDRLGHAAGDELLVAIAERLRGRLRRGDLLARLGGDEFLVVLAGLDRATAAAEAGHVAAGLAAAVREPVELRGELVGVAASVGVSTSAGDGDDFSALLHAADVRMYAAKGPAVR